MCNQFLPLYIMDSYIITLVTGDTAFMCVSTQLLDTGIQSPVLFKEFFNEVRNVTKSQIAKLLTRFI